MGVPAELRGIEVIECPHCGNADPVITNLDGVMQAAAMGILCSGCTLSGEEVRFLRKYVNKSAREFARILHLDHTHLSKIENGHEKIGPQTDKLVRLLVMNMGPGLATKVNKLIELMPEIDDSCSGAHGVQIDAGTLTQICA
jgi:DNA-binding transcriptional regulator YiaG